MDQLEIDKQIAERRKDKRFIARIRCSLKQNRKTLAKLSG